MGPVDKVALVEYRATRQVLEYVCVLHHLLEHVHIEDLLYLRIQLIVSYQVWFSNYSVHEFLHNFFSFLLIERELGLFSLTQRSQCMRVNALQLELFMHANGIIGLD